MKPQIFILLTGLTVTCNTNTLRQNVHTNVRCVVSKISWVYTITWREGTSNIKNPLLNCPFRATISSDAAWK